MFRIRIYYLISDVFVGKSTACNTDKCSVIKLRAKARVKIRIMNFTIRPIQCYPLRARCRFFVCNKVLWSMSIEVRFMVIRATVTIVSQKIVAPERKSLLIGFCVMGKVLIVRDTRR